MKHTLLSLAFSAVAVSGLTVAGCKSDEGHRDSVASTANKSRLSYDQIGARIDDDLGRLNAIENEAGTPSQYRGVVSEVRTDITSLIASADDTYGDLCDANENRIAHIRKDASEHSNNRDNGNAASRLLGVDDASRQASRVEKLRTNQDAFVDDAAKLRVALMKAKGSLSDVESTVSTNPVDESVKLSKGSLSEAISRLKKAKGALGDLRKDLLDIRDYQPRSIDR
jgi:outer membrane murein-binding lipoprotein Lpp